MNFVIADDGTGMNILFGHARRSYLDDNLDNKVRPGETVGESGSNHLHFGVRTGVSVHHNPLPFFSPELQTQIVGEMTEGGDYNHWYPDGFVFHPYSMSWFDGEGDGGGNFWTHQNCDELELIFQTPLAFGIGLYYDSR
jgi:hypothetical protein